MSIPASAVIAAMEWIEAAIEFILWITDGGLMLIDLYSWMKGKENRIERRAAKKAGEPLPERDPWNRRVIFLSVTILFLTSYLVWGLLR